MKWILKHKIAASLVAIVVFLLWKSSKAAAGQAPQVGGVVTSGSQGLIIDTNVLSPTFGEPL